MMRDSTDIYGWSLTANALPMSPLGIGEDGRRDAGGPAAIRGRLSLDGR